MIDLSKGLRHYINVLSEATDNKQSFQISTPQGNLEFPDVATYKAWQTNPKQVAFSQGPGVQYVSMAAPSSASTPAKPAASPQNSMDDSDDVNAHAFDPTWGGTKATGGQTVAPNANATWDNNKQMAVPNAPAAPAAPAAPINRDSMTFGQAFADARAKGEKQFNWKGKPYAVKLAPAKTPQGGMTSSPSATAPQVDQMGNVTGAGTYGESQYREDQSLARIIQLSR